MAFYLNSYLNNLENTDTFAQFLFSSSASNYQSGQSQLNITVGKSTNLRLNTLWPWVVAAECKCVISGSVQRMAFVSRLATETERRTSGMKRAGWKEGGGLYKQAQQVSAPAFNTGDYTSFFLLLKQSHLKWVA